MKAYSKPELKKLGTMAAVTRKSGPAFDVELMAAAQADGYDPCEFYPCLLYTSDAADDFAVV